MITGLYPIRLTLVTCHLLVDDDGCVLIDTGLFGEHWLVARKMKQLGRPLGDIKAIILTHGHLDHAGNLARLKAMSGASVYGHRDEQIHVDGRYPYTGIARVCGVLEAIGRVALGYRPAAIDHFFDDGEVLPFWGGLEVVHLPGHTLGHCGFYSRSRDLLFVGDQVVCSVFGMVGPLRIFTSHPQLVAANHQRIADLDPAGLVPNHYWRLNPTAIRRRFDDFWAKRRAVTNDENQ